MHPFRSEPPRLAEWGGLWAVSPRGPSPAPEQPPPQGSAGTAWDRRRASLPSGLRRPAGRQRQDRSPRDRDQAQPRPDPPSRRRHRRLILREPETPSPACNPARCLSAERPPSPVEAGLTAGAAAAGTLYCRNLRAGGRVPAGAYREDTEHLRDRIPPLGHLVPRLRSPRLRRCRFFPGTPPRRCVRHVLRPCRRSCCSELGRAPGKGWGVPAP